MSADSHVPAEHRPGAPSWYSKVQRWARWRLAPAATRWTWLSGVIVAGFHVLAAVTLIRFALAGGAPIWESVPGGPAIIVAIALGAVIVALWDMIAVIARPSLASRAAKAAAASRTAKAAAASNAASPPHASEALTPLLARAYGLIPVAMASESALSASMGEAASSGGVISAIMLGLIAITLVLAGVACIASVAGRPVPIVGGEARPMRAPAARGIMRAGRVSLGIVVVTLGLACVVDVVLFAFGSEVGFAHAVGLVWHIPGGIAIPYVAAALLAVCAVSATVRAVVTARGGGQPNVRAGEGA